MGGRDDLKAKLGKNLFKGETHCVERDDLTMDSINTEKLALDQLPYTADELLQKEEHAQSARPSGKTEKTMKSVSFGVTNKLTDAFKDFVDRKIDWIEVCVTKDEQLDIVKGEAVGKPPS